jgi:hypothetical protein
MARHLFIGQQTLTTWTDQDKVEFHDNVMTIKADGRRFKLVEAVRFIKVEGGDEDVPGLLGRVKTNEQLESMGAERYRDSVIYQDVAYKVQEGFIGEVFLKKETEQQPPTAEPAAPEPAEEPPERPVPHARTRPTLPVAEQATKPPPAGKPKKPKGAAHPKTSGAVKGTEGAADEEPTDEELLVQFLLNNTPK